MNKGLLLDGVNYISASQASLQTGYASDYIGQLIRDGRVPGKMIGRTWYVDFSSLQNYMQDSPKKKKNSSNLVSLTPVTPLNRIENFLPALTKKQSFTPALSKNVQITTVPRVAEMYIATKKYPKQLSLFKAGASATAVLIALFTLSAWVSYLLPGAARQTNIVVAQASNAVVEHLTPAAVSEGMVVAPDKSDHQSLVDRIAKNFSDNVNVTFDQSGQSGVVTPVFSSSTSAGSYAFILVPVTSQ